MHRRRVLLPGGLLTPLTAGAQPAGKVLGLTIPAPLLARADHVIE